MIENQSLESIMGVSPRSQSQESLKNKVLYHEPAFDLVTSNSPSHNSIENIAFYAYAQIL